MDKIQGPGPTAPTLGSLGGCTDITEANTGGLASGGVSSRQSAQAQEQRDQDPAELSVRCGQAGMPNTPSCLCRIGPLSKSVGAVPSF